MLTWHCSLFNELVVHTLYNLIKARVDVFVVEQNCPYPELDGVDTLPDTKHLFATYDNQIAAYARIIAPHVSYPDHCSIGRVLVTSDYRKNKLGHTLIKQAIQAALISWPDTPIKIGAQSHLEDFYRTHGFKKTSTPYMEDGIEHIAMVLTI